MKRLPISQRDDNLLRLLRYAMNVGQPPVALTADEWQQLFDDARRHALVGVLCEALKRMPHDARTIPLPLMLRWAGDAESIAQLNTEFNAEAARLTSLLEGEGHDTVILKGQANALLYPNPLSRQPGDIDIWVSGGKDNVLDTLHRLGMADDNADVCFHHVALERNAKGIEVEVHFQPSSGHNQQACNQHMQDFLNAELACCRTMVAEGFRVPTMCFALVMQLAHIRHHLLKEGVGLRQVIDYWMLLRASSADDRREVSQRLRQLGLLTMARALMWVVSQLFAENECLLQVVPSRRKGLWLLRRMLRTGNFGHHDRQKQDVLWREVARQKLELLPLLWFEPEFAGTLLAEEWRYWGCIVRKLPDRIRHRSLSLRDHPESWG